MESGGCFGKEKQMSRLKIDDTGVVETPHTSAEPSQAFSFYITSCLDFSSQSLASRCPKAMECD